MSSVDRIANQLLSQDRRIGALERSRSLSKSALVNASIPVMVTNPDTGELEIVGELGQPTFEDIGKLYDDSVKFSEDMKHAQGKLEEVETGLATAQDTANTAAAEAQAARQEVEAAVEAAGDAAALAATAEQAAQDAAGIAQTAQNTAEDARTVADGTASDLLTLAGRTGRLIRSATAPTGDDATENNLWIDTSSGQLHEYDGTEWVPVTDPRLAEASQKADQAAAQATTAAEAADRAETLAEASKTLAESASTVAGDAQAAALAAQSEASAATATATAAQSASQTAQQEAQQALDDAAAAAGIAEGKADLWLSSSTPPAAYRRDNVLWYDPTAKVLKRWTTGTTWVVVEEQAVIDAAAAAAEARTDALQALEDAQDAKDAADAAAANALLAQNAADEAGNKATTASGRITVASANPTAQDGIGKPDGALWEVREGSTSLRRFVWDGSAWSPYSAGFDFFSDEVSGSIEDAKDAADAAQAAADQAAQDAIDKAAAAEAAAKDYAEAEAAAAQAAAIAAAAGDATSKANAAEAAAIAAAALDAQQKADAAQAAAEAKAQTAQDAADAAEAAALGAQSRADAAHGLATTADGRITVATANPKASDATGKPIGAIWEVRSGGVALRRFVLTGATTWTPIKIGQDFIGSNAIGSAQIIDAAIGTAQIADAAITNAKIGNATIETAKIKDGAITNAKILNGTITNAEILDGTIGTAEIADAAITNAKIGDMDVGKLNVTDTARIKQAVAEKIIGDAAYFGALAVSKLSVGDLTNLIPDGDLRDPSFANWRGSTLARVDDTPPYMEWTAARVGNAHVYNDHRFEIERGQEYWFSGEVSAPSTNTAAVSVTAAMQIKTEAGSTIWPRAGAPMTLQPGGGWVKLEGVLTIPNGVYTTGQFDPFASSSVAGQKVQMRRMTLRRRASAVLIEDGAVTAPKIKATAELWAKMLTVAGDATIGGNLIVDESISTRHLMIGAVTPTALADSTLDQISVDIANATGALSEAVSGDIQNAVDTVTTDRETILAEYATQASVDTGIAGAVTNATELIEQLGLSLSTDLQEYQEHIDQFIRMDNNGIAIGKLGSPFSVRITNTKMSFLQGTRVVAYLSNDRLYITDAEIVNRLSLGRPGSGFFEFEPRTNGNLTFKFRSA